MVFIAIFFPHLPETFEENEGKGSLEKEILGVNDFVQVA